jgi:S1-C subfamily serine protease
VTLASKRIAERLEINGVLVINVQPGTSAAKAGIQETRQVGDDLILGDIIQAVNGEAVESYDDLRNEVDKFHIGDEVTLSILRGEEQLKISLRLEEIE